MFVLPLSTSRKFGHPVKKGTRRVAALSSLVLAAGLITACGESEEVSQTAATGGDGKTVYPLVLDNCGQSVTVDGGWDV